MIKRARTLMKLAATGATLSLMAACAQEGGSDTQTSATSTPSTTSTPQSATVSGGNCAQDQGGNLFVSVGQSTLKVQTSTIEDLIPSGIEGQLSVEKVKGALQSRFSEGFGCQNKPLNVAFLVLKAQTTDPKLDGLMVLKDSPSREVIDASVKLTTQLQSNPGGRCREVGKSLIQCVGTARQGDQTKQIMYAVSTDKSQKLSTGGPLAANCVAVKDAPADCRIIDHLGGNITFEARIKPGKYDATNLQAAWRAAVQTIDALRV